MHLTLAQISKLCQGELSDNSDINMIITHVIIDSRRMKTSSGLFVAINGQNIDGHSFVNEVVADGHNAAIVDENCRMQLPNLIYVKDTSKALAKLAAGYRQFYNLPVIAITGSNGKTTVKEMLKEVCNYHFGKEHVLASEGTLNNHLGLPLTILEMNSQHRVAILEMGMNHTGEIHYLSEIAAPTMAVVNNVMLAHAGNFNSIAEIAAAKYEVYDGLSGNQATACVNRQIQYAANWEKDLIKRRIKIFPYADNDSGCYIEQISVNGAIYQTPQGKFELKLNILGEHNYYNALTVLALALNLKIPLSMIKLALEGFRAYKQRLELKAAFNGATIVDDTYNANPDSVIAAIKSIAKLPRPHWLILGDLNELGLFTKDAHERIGKIANEYKIDKLLTLGELTSYTADKFSGNKIHFNNRQDIVQYCHNNLPNSATLLIKGSRSMFLEDVVAGLIAVDSEQN